MTLVDSSDVLARVVASNGAIRSLTLVRFPILPPGDERAPLEHASAKAVAAAKELRGSIKLPFWDAAMLMSALAASPTSGLFQAALFHNVPGAPLVLDRDQVSPARLRHSYESATDAEIVAVLSRVGTQDGHDRHIPMLDFHVAENDSSQSSVIEVVRALHLRGYVLASGKSYHFIGSNLISPKELIALLGRALLFTPIVDRTWIAHQLVEGNCALRISTRKGYGGPPRVVAEVA
jgi:hypothetical protein